MTKTLKYFVILLSLSVVQAGLLTLFNEWSDELQKNTFPADTKCRERRQTEANGIKAISLTDIERDARLENQKTSPKSKRCPIGEYVGNPLTKSSEPLPNPFSLVKRESQTATEIKCRNCMNQLPCKVLKKCDECYKYCKHDPVFTNDPSTFGLQDEVVQMAPRQSKTRKVFPVGFFMKGETQEIICRIIGVSNISDIESLTILATTYSNKSPQINGHPFRNKKFNSRENGAFSDETDGILPQIKSRFFDYDSGEDDSDVSQLRSLNENLKENPDVIEEPPPYLGNKAEQIIVEPKEFESSESDSVEDENSVNVTDTALPSILSRSQDASTPSPLLDSKASRGGFLHKLLQSPPIVTTPPQSSPGLSELKEALQEVKIMVKNLQEEAQKSSDQRLLSSPHLTEQPSSANHLVDNLKEVNKYLVNRAQDALDTVGHSHGKQEGDVDSENTKKIITDLKKMPQFLLSKAKTVLNGFDKKISENQRPDEIIGVTHKNEVNTEIPSTTIAFKNKFEKYMDDLKKRRQNQYSPENILKNSQISSRIQNLKEEPSSKSTHSQLLQLPQDLEKRREELKSKLQQVLAKKPLVDNKEWVEVGAKEPAELSTEATIKETSPSSTSTSIFLPTLISTPITKKPDILKKYLENLRSNSVLPSLKQSNPLTSDNQSESTRKVNLFKDKIKNYVDNMKNPLEPKVESRLAEEQEVKTPRKSESEKLKEIFKATLGQDPKPINNEILETVNKPEQVKDEKDFLSLSRASTEKRKEELNNLRNKLLNLAKGQFNKPSSILGSSIGKKNDEGNKEQIVGKPLDINTLLGMENSSKSADNNDIIEWSSNLGQIVQSSSKPQDVFFIGKGIKLPMKISKGEDGVLDFSVDLDKLCSCKNSTCPKNHTAIEQTVSTILEAEAELKDQLSHPEQMENDNEPSLKRSIINKRSTDVTGLMLGLENQQKKIENTLANSINKLQDDTRKVTNQVLNGVNSPSLMKQSVKNTIETQRRKVAQESEKINNAVVNNVKQMERDRIIKKILNQLNYPKLPLDHPESQYLTNNLKQLYKTLQSPEKIIEKANFNLNKLTTTVNPLALFNNQMKKSLTEDILNFQNPIQTGQIDVLENKLQQLDNEVKKYEDKSEKLFIDESKKLLGSHTNKVIDEEVNIISKLLSWISDFSKVEKNEI